MEKIIKERIPAFQPPWRIIVVLFLGMLIYNPQALPSSITCVVTDADTDEPIENANVKILPNGPIGKTDADGEYTFTDLAADVYTIKASKLGYESGKKTTNLKTDEDKVVKFNLQPLEGPGTIHGTVIDGSTTLPILGAEVMVLPDGPSAMTDGDGSYDLGELDPGDYELQASKDGYKTRIKNVTLIATQNKTVDFTLIPEPLGSITCTVLDSSNDNPIEGAMVQILPAGPSGTTNADGEYVFVDFEAGTYQIRASKKDYQSVDIEVVVKPGKDEKVPFKLEPLFSVTINEGEKFATKKNVSLALTYTKNVVWMRIWNEGAKPPRTWIRVSPDVKRWALPSSVGEKAVNVEFKNASGETSGPVSDDIFLDNQPPKGTVKINNNAPKVKQGQDVELSLTADDGDGSGIAKMGMMISNTAKFTDAVWEPFATTKTWTLNPGTGTRTVYVKFRDKARNESATIRDSITVTP